MSVSLGPGANGVPRLQLSHPSGSSAEVYLLGAHVTSWIPADRTEALFLSRASEFAPGQAIRGGVPVVFPQFAQRGPLPKHGFARVMSWRWLDPGATTGDATEATLELIDSEATRAIWPHAFRARLTVGIDERTLSQRLDVENTGGSAFAFTAALHSYFAVAELRRTSLQGLAGTAFEERSARGESAIEGAEEIVVSGEFDRVYLDAPRELSVHDRGNERGFRLRLDGFSDVVVWNPGRSGAAALQDMADDEYPRMICVEAAQVGRAVELVPGGAWAGGQIVEVTARP